MTDRNNSSAASEGAAPMPDWQLAQMRRWCADPRSEDEYGYDCARYLLAEVDRLRAITSAAAQPAPDLLQEIHDAVNALGGRSDQDNSYDQGIVDTVSKALDIIETRLVSQPSPAATVEKIGRVDREGGWNAGREPAATVPARETVARILAHKMPSLRMANDTPGNYAHSIADEIVAALTNEPQAAPKLSDFAELKLLIDEYDPENSDWNFRRGVLLDILVRVWPTSSQVSRPQCPSESAPGASIPAQQPRE